MPVQIVLVENLEFPGITAKAFQELNSEITFPVFLLFEKHLLLQTLEIPEILVKWRIPLVLLFSKLLFDSVSRTMRHGTLLISKDSRL